ncbi:MAG: proteasome subunit beta [Proteobacteria bacterium]|nr:proteasome subunit beta [Pseudomonadota bacterium]
MTTIAYNHKDKEIAYDSRLTTGNDIYTDSAVKMKKVGGVVYFMSGRISDYDDFIKDFEPRKQAIDNLECSMLCVQGGKVYWLSIDNGLYTKTLSTCNDAIGSGYPWVMAAMDFGKSAKEAVEYAKTRDCKTGGKVKVFKIGD